MLLEQLEKGSSTVPQRGESTSREVGAQGIPGKQSGTADTVPLLQAESDRGSLPATLKAHDLIPAATGGDGENADPLIGKTILGRFFIEQQLGAGGMGSVYLAQQTAVQREVALKVLHPELSTDSGLTERFSREAHAVSQLKSPNTIVLFDFGSAEDGRLYMAMEYVEGRTLGQLIDQSGALPPMRAIAICLQLLTALIEAHERGIVHRDLKPENIMLVTRAGTPDFVKVLDFGIAKIVGADDPNLAPVDAAKNRVAARAAGHSQLTQQGDIFGSPRYMAPEQAFGEAVTARTDIYAVGVILYEMLCGRPPFATENTLRLLHDHAHTPVTPLSEAFPQLNIPKELCTLVTHCLQKDPEARPLSALALSQALREVTGVVAARQQAEERALERLVGIRRPRRRQLAQVASGGALALLGFLIGLFFAMGPSVEDGKLSPGAQVFVASSAPVPPRWLPQINSPGNRMVGVMTNLPSLEKALRLAEARALTQILGIPLRFAAEETNRYRTDLEHVAETYAALAARRLPRKGSYWIKAAEAADKGIRYRYHGYVRLDAGSRTQRAELRRAFATLRYRNGSFLLDLAVRRRRCDRAATLMRVVASAIEDSPEKKVQRRSMAAYLSHQVGPCHLKPPTITIDGPPKTKKSKTATRSP